MVNRKINDRIIAVDFLRGLTIALMILVNNPGHTDIRYNQLKHAEWHGITMADFIFPMFIVIMGISISLSFSKKITKKVPIKKLNLKIVKRTLILFLLGLFISLLVYPAYNGFRIAGVLQRIAIVYLVCSYLFLYTSWKWQFGIGMFLLVAYNLILIYIPVPGGAHPNLDPGTNIVSWFDKLYLPGMLYAENHDPEGILSTIPSIASGISGVLIGKLLIIENSFQKKLAYISLAGIAMIIVGLLWSNNFPLNKNLWTSSFVFVTSGTAALLLVLSILLIDQWKLKIGVRPFLIFGTNAITVYLLSFIFLYLVWPPFFGEGTELIHLCYNAFISIGIDEYLSSFLWSILYTILCFVPIYFLYTKKIFIKV